MLSLILKSEKKIPGRVSFKERSAMMSGIFITFREKKEKRKMKKKIPKSITFQTEGV